MSLDISTADNHVKPSIAPPSQAQDQPVTSFFLLAHQSLHLDCDVWFEFLMLFHLSLLFGLIRCLNKTDIYSYDYFTYNKLLYNIGTLSNGNRLEVKIFLYLDFLIVYCYYLAVLSK